MPFEPGSCDAPFVDVVVPVHDEEAYIAEKIENLLALDYPAGKIRFWIVDGASRDATLRAAATVAAGDPRFTLLRAGAADKARQMNLALSKCRGDWILVTDADSRLAADTLRNLVKEGVSAPRTGAVGVAVTPAQPHPWEELHWRESDGVRLREAARGSASIVTGPCYLVRREIVDRFPPGVVADDVHVAFRTAAAGLRTGFIPGNVTELRTPASIRELIAHKLRKARAYVREIFRFLPRLGAMRGDSRRTFLRHAAKMLLFPLAVVPAAALAVRAAGAPVTLSAAFAAASVLAARTEWRRRAALAALLTAVLFVATVSLPFVGLRLSYRKVDARRLPLAEDRRGMKNSAKIAIGARILAARLTNRPRPFFVQYSLLNGCNARCVYCNSPDREDRPLSFDQHVAILRDFARLGAARIKFLGGEPLLVREIGALADEVRRLGMRTAMVTNGFLIPEKFDTVRKMDEVVISIDGAEEAHDRQRGPGAWTKVMRGIDLCAKEGLDFFLSAVVTRRSADQIPWLLETASRLRIMVNFQIPQFNEEMYGAGARAWMPDPDDIRRIVAEIIAAKENGAPVLFTTRSYRRTLAWPDFALERVERPGKRSPCTAGRYFLQMEPNGDVYPCVLHIGAFRPFNAARDGVEKAWRHAGEHSCFRCYNTWLNENRAIFDLSPAVLGNFWSNYLNGRASSPRPD